jgi:hypothetical protein
VSLPDAREHHGRVINDTIQKTNEKGLANSAARWLPKDTVCLSRTASVGYVFRLGRPMATSQDFVNWVCSEVVDPRFLMHALLAEGDHLLNFGKGTTHTTIYFPEVLAFHLNLAPLPEQHRIVDKVEALLAQVNKAKDRLDRVKVILKRFRQAVLAAACFGKLTEEWRDEPASRPTPNGHELVAAVLRSRAEAGVGRRKRPLALPPDRSIAVPEQWAWASFDQIAELITKGSSPGWQGFDYIPRGVLFVRSQNVRWGTLDLSETVHVDPAFSIEHASSVIRTGDVLLNLVGASVGRSAIATHEVDGANCNQAVGIIRPVPRGLSSEWISLWLLSSFVQSHITENKADVARANFNLDDIKAMGVPVPPVAEQTEIVRVVQEMFALADAIEARLAAATARAEKLPQ